MTVAHAWQNVEIEQKNGTEIYWPYRTFGESGMRISTDESAQMISGPDDMQMERTRETAAVTFKTITHKTATRELWRLLYKILFRCKKELQGKDSDVERSCGFALEGYPGSCCWDVSGYRER